MSCGAWSRCSRHRQRGLRAQRHTIGRSTQPCIPPAHAAPHPAEPGQGAFAAIAEIVALLEADPNTDWSKADIGALREHLVDMNELILNALAREEPIPGGLRITVTGEGETLRAIRSMVPAHAAELAKIEGWQVEAAAQDEGAGLTVTSTDPRQQARIRGLGFFGLMATGAHHRAHHWAIATGQPVHQR